MTTQTSPTISPATAAPPEEHRAAINVNLVIAPLMLGALAYGVLGSVIVPALPLFQRDLHTTETGATWLLTSYFLAAAGATAILGRLGDMFGKRRMMMVTLTILSVGTLISAVSSSLALELVGRTFQGAAGGLFPLAFGIIRDEFPHEKVKHGVAAITAMISLGAAGVILPGLIVPPLSWHWLFWIPMILALLALAGTWRLVPESPVRPGGAVNWLNAALMMSGITATIVGISEGSQWGWTSGRTLGLLLGGLTLCTIWIVAESRSSRPLINMSLMRLRGVWTTNIVAFMIGAGMYAAFALYPIFAQLPKSSGFAYGASLWHTGLYMLPLPIMSGIASPFAGHLGKQIGAIRALIVACLISAAGFGYMALLYAHPYDMMISLGLVGLGLGLGLPTLFMNVLHSVPAKSVGETTGMNTVVRMIGGAVGTQVVSSLITSNARHGLPRLSGFTRSLIAEVAFMVVAALAASLISARHATRPR